MEVDVGPAVEEVVVSTLTIIEVDTSTGAATIG